MKISKPKLCTDNGSGFVLRCSNSKNVLGHGGRSELHAGKVGVATRLTKVASSKDDEKTIVLDNLCIKVSVGGRVPSNRRGAAVCADKNVAAVAAHAEDRGERINGTSEGAVRVAADIGERETSTRSKAAVLMNVSKGEREEEEEEKSYLRNWSFRLSSNETGHGSTVVAARLVVTAIGGVYCYLGEVWVEHISWCAGLSQEATGKIEARVCEGDNLNGIATSNSVCLGELLP